MENVIERLHSAEMAILTLVAFGGYNPGHTDLDRSNGYKSLQEVRSSVQSTCLHLVTEHVKGTPPKEPLPKIRLQPMNIDELEEIGEPEEKGEKEL